ncbi:AmpG family muropeptide MFS transporter [Agarilytica rhodophyticola]|uniref:AmpG family muropeptide MFS transporter n=1 Tax=Agarilytica rhodophyticola TaxID=1737490 RepID=UPI001C1FD8DC|nr:MFS transporter [Agarilytica rhodophyticola]
MIAGKSFLRQLQIYFDRRVVSIFILGIAQGLPWVMIGTMLTLWLKESGISRADIGYAALIFSVYAINFLWSPIVDVVSPPFLSRFGQRQSWIFLCQLVIAFTCFFISVIDPTTNAIDLVLLCLLIASVSATQDIAIDAYRVDSFEQHETNKVSAAAGMITAGWWTGYAGIGAIPLFLSDKGWQWPDLYMLLGGMTVLLCIASAILPTPKYHSDKTKHLALNTYLSMASTAGRWTKALLFLSVLLPISLIIWSLNGSPGLSADLRQSSLFVPSIAVGVFFFVIIFAIVLSRLTSTSNSHLSSKTATLYDISLAWILVAVVAPLREFFSRNGVKLSIALLLFVLLFKLGEAFLGRMSILFYKEVGFTNSQIATYSKILSWWLTVVFALVGGLINARLGLLKGLLISGIAMASTNLLFALIAVVGPEEDLYALAVILDGFTAGWSTVAFVSFISLLCNHAFSATQYALLASLGNLGRTSLSSFSGQIVDWLDGNWALFFILTTIMIIPSLIILIRLRHYIGHLVKSSETAYKELSNK